MFFFVQKNDMQILEANFLFYDSSIIFQKMSVLSFLHKNCSQNIMSFYVGFFSQDKFYKLNFSIITSKITSFQRSFIDPMQN